MPGKSMPILEVIRAGDLEGLLNLIVAGADLREEDEDGCFTALGEAAYHGRVEMVRLLLGAGVSPDDSAHECALGAAALGGQVETARLLIESGASLEGAGESGLTPLMNAARVGHLEAVRYLVGVGADFEQRYQESRWPPSRSALDFAVECGHVEVAMYLLERGARFEGEDYQDENGRMLKSPADLVELARRNRQRQASQADQAGVRLEDEVG